MSNTEMLIRLIGAAVLGSMIGLERERLLWAAGIRTHMLVCVGSCLIMIVSQYGFSNILTYEHAVLDPSRIAAQVVSGIGFLGAGAILARGEIVKGLTTAASIWTVAAIGLAVGGALYLAAGASTHHHFDHPGRHRWRPRSHRREESAWYGLTEGLRQTRVGAA